jgi:glycerol-1-phosphate dehydrogenase [NAD(P)+]
MLAGMDTVSTGKKTGDQRIDTLYNEYGPGLLARLPEILAEHLGEGPFIIVTDGRIWEAVGKRLEPFLSRRPDTILHVLPASPQPYASDILVVEIAARIATADAAPIALGSGTVNDIVKRASFEVGRRYACLPTAPSVDGYSSYGAAITVGGFKATLDCPAPLCVVADADIVAAAPYELVAAGYGDLLAKLTGGADWILADAMGIEAIDREIWDMVQPKARAILDRAEALRDRDAAAISLLYSGLAMSGLAMQRYRDSRPASGAEHLLSHTWEMSHADNEGRAASHGFKVALGTLVAAALCEELFSPESAAGRALRERDFAPAEELLARRLGLAESELAGHPSRERTERVIRAKTPAPEELAARAKKARELWGAMGAAVRGQIPPFGLLKERLAAAGCPTEPSGLGLSATECLRSLALASLIRPRYTVLDLASELGVLKPCAEGIFSPRYFSSYSPGE